jgi:hypothetical protein
MPLDASGASPQPAMPQGPQLTQPNAIPAW